MRDSGSQIEEWTLDSVTATCKGMEIKPGYSQHLWDTAVVPYLDTTLKGFTWCKPPARRMHGWMHPRVFSCQLALSPWMIA